MRATKRIITRLALAVVLIAGLAVGCDRPTNTVDVGTTPSFGKTEAFLTAFGQCTDLKDYLAQVYLNEMEKQWEGGNDVYYTDTNVIGAPRPQAGTTTGSTTTGPVNDSNTGGTLGGTTTGTETKNTPNHTETNNQEKGVDEADIIKTDGTHLYVLNNRSLRILAVWPAKDTKELGSLTLTDTPSEMFVYKNKLLLFSYSWYYGTTNNGNIVGGVEPAPTRPTDVIVPDEKQPVEQPKPIAPEVTGERTRITIVDISDRSKPTIEREIVANGSYVSSRMIDGSVHLVLRANLKMPNVYYYGGPYYGGDTIGVPVTGTGTVAPSTTTTSTTGTDSTTKPLTTSDVYVDPRTQTQPKTKEEAIKQLKAALDAGKLEDWLPSYAVIAADGSTIDSGVLTPCNRFFKPSVQMGLNVLSVLTINLNASGFASTAILGNSETVYASKDKLILAGYVWGYWYWNADKSDDTDLSYVHQFGLEKDQVVYEASGKVKGYILNQFSLSESKGYIRLATSTQRWQRDDQSTNSLFVMQKSGDLLSVVGQVTGLAPGERIYSARFLGDRAYIVTFRETDPLYTFDLTDPRNPKKLGELKVPGFSTYIHPLGENHLLTIGKQTIEENGFTRTAGTKLTIFDVTDPTTPKEAFTLALGNGSSSEAEYDHKAFNFFADKGILAIPVQNYYWEKDPSGQTKPEVGLKIFKISVEEGIVEKGLITHDSFLDTTNRDPAYYYTEVPIRRSVMIEDFIYSISNYGVKVSLMSDLSDLVSVQFPYEPTYYGCNEFYPCVDPMPGPVPTTGGGTTGSTGTTTVDPDTTTP